MGSRSLGRPVNGMQYGRHNGPFPSSFAIFSSPLFPVHLSLAFFASLSTFSCTSCILFASTFSSVFFFFSPSKELSNRKPILSCNGKRRIRVDDFVFPPLRVALLSAIFSQRAHTGRTCVSDTCARVPYPLVEVSPTRCVYATCSLPGFVIFHPEN